VGVIVTFDYNAWVALYPEFASPGGSIPVTSQQAALYFSQAELIHANDGSGPVCDATQQLGLLNMVTAHIAALFSTPSGAAEASQLVGRISDATTGSVHVATENDYPPGTPQWWQQTKYGSMYWLATSQFRTFRYKPNPRSPVQNSFLFPGWNGF
jgi:hypothetical protein